MLKPTFKMKEKYFFVLVNKNHLRFEFDVKLNENYMLLQWAIYKIKEKKKLFSYSDL